MTATAPTAPQYFNGIDILRVLACCMVLTIHSCECYYISNYFSTGSVETLDVAAWHGEAFWSGIIGSLCRVCVPMFVVISGFLLLPMKKGMTMRDFYLKRATRVLIPLFIWTIVYAFYQAFKFGEDLHTLGDYSLYILQQIGFFFVNFPGAIGHLWYPYMCIGLYLFIPFISPWVEKATRGEMHVFLGLWVLALLLPYYHLAWPEVLGECAWNPDGTLYHFSGFIGYLIFGAYCRKFLFNSGKSFIGWGLLLTIIGYGTTLFGFLYQLYHLVPTADNYNTLLNNLEFTWFFPQITVAMTTMGIFLLLFRCPVKRLPRIVSDYSRLTYGVYLCHIMFLTWFYEHLIVSLTWPTPCKILSIACLTIITAYLLIKALSYLPKSKYIVG